MRADRKATRGGLSWSRGGVENRHRILLLLTGQPLTNKQLLEKSGVKAPTLSKHLKALTEGGLVRKAISAENKVVYEVISKNTALDKYLNFVMEMIRFSYGSELYPDIEERIKTALKENLERKTEEEKTKKPENEENKEQRQKINMKAHNRRTGEWREV